MIIEGIVKEVLKVESGISQKGNPWQKASYIILQNINNRDVPVKVTVFGEQRIQTLALAPGQNVRLNVDAESREFNGNWYTDLNAWSRVVEAQQPAQAAPAQPVIYPDAPQQPAAGATTLPF